MTHWRQHPQYELLKERMSQPPYNIVNDRGECSQLVWNKGMAECSIYETRPWECSTFPLSPFAIETIPECTYSFRKE